MKHWIGPAAVVFALFTAAAAFAGAGWEFKRSLPVGSKTYGYGRVSAPHPVRWGKTSERFEVRPGDCGRSRSGRSDDCTRDRERSELIQVGELQRAGSEYWYGWSLYVPGDFETIYPVKVYFGQFHQKKAKPAFMFTNADGGYWLDVHLKGRPYRSLIAADELRGRWHDFVVRVRWSQDAGGVFDVWADGAQKVRYRGPTMTASTVYFKYGLYRSFVSRNPKSKSVTQVVYFDEVRRGRSRSDVDVRLRRASGSGDGD